METPKKVAKTMEKQANTLVQRSRGTKGWKHHLRKARFWPMNEKHVNRKLLAKEDVLIEQEPVWGYRPPLLPLPPKPKMKPIPLSPEKLKPKPKDLRQNCQSRSIIQSRSLNFPVSPVPIIDGQLQLPIYWHLVPLA